MRFKTDVAIIGAGAAGLAAASVLRRSGVDTLLFEARARIGGRAFSIETPDGLPVELGAEFLHGRAAVTRQIMQRSGEAAADMAGTMFELHEGTLREATRAWDATASILLAVRAGEEDESVRAFLERARGAYDDRDIDLTALLVEGFDAAVLENASVRAIAEEWNSDTNDSQARPTHGYAPVMRRLASECGDCILLESAIESVTVKGAGVELRGRRFGMPFEVSARAVIVSVPIGAVQHGDIAFNPPLPARVRDAIGSLAMGPVVKVVLRFATAFWESLDDGAVASASFFQIPEAPMRTVWTQTPLRRPTLTAWAGGGAAERLGGDAQQHIAAALESVERLFPRYDVAAALRASYTHDWQRDPYSRGAYSYVKTGGCGAREILAQTASPVVFAGEACSVRQSGTVAGAIETGYAAADAILTA